MFRHTRTYIVLTYSITLSVFCMLILTLGCTPGYWGDRTNPGVGGGQDAVAVHMPFASGYTARCTQGAGGEYSHRYTSTAYDIDLDTPNDANDLVFAPVSGVIYVHDDDSETGFGVHVNINYGDGSYITIGHLSKVFIDNGVEVAAGQLIGYEGTTGASSGDHVHLGRHSGDASKDATLGTSIEGLELYATNVTTGASEPFSTSSMTCSLSSGHVYQSQLPTVLWHPNGTLVKTPDRSTIYQIDNGNARAFLNEEDFWANGHSFDDVVLVSGAELACYGSGRAVTTESQGSEVYTNGTLLTEVSTSAVYVVTDGMAMPIADWQTFLMMGYQQNNIVTVDAGRVAELFDRVGDCGINAYCLDYDDAITCGGPTGKEVEDEQVEDSGEASADDTGVVKDNPVDLKVYWESADAKRQDSITLSGEYLQANGSTSGWKNWRQVSDQNIVSATFANAQSGDSFRFSVEFTRGGETSWSCLAPFPAGTVQGVVWAEYDGAVLDAYPVADPTSDGCGLLVTVP